MNRKLYWGFLLGVGLAVTTAVVGQVYNFFPPPGLTYSTTAGDAGGSLLTFQDSLHMNSPTVPAHNPAISLSSLNGINYIGDSTNATFNFDNGGTGAFAIAGAASVNVSLPGGGGNQTWSFFNSGDVTFTGPQSGIDFEETVQNTSAGANSYALFELQDSVGAGCFFYSQLNAGATHLPNSVGSLVGATGYPNGGNYITCNGSGKTLVFGISGTNGLSTSKAFETVTNSSGLVTTTLGDSTLSTSVTNIVGGSAANTQVNGNPIASSTTGNFTITYTGMTAGVTGTAVWSLAGNVVVLFFPAATGTSNTTAFTATGLPAAIQPARTQRVEFPDFACENNTVVGVTTDCEITLTASSGTVTFLNGGNAAGWTNVGTKGIANAATVSYILN